MGRVQGADHDPRTQTKLKAIPKPAQIPKNFIWEKFGYIPENLRSENFQMGRELKQEFDPHLLNNLHTHTHSLSLLVY